MKGLKKVNFLSIANEILQIGNLDCLQRKDHFAPIDKVFLHFIDKTSFALAGFMNTMHYEMTYMLKDEWFAGWPWTRRPPYPHMRGLYGRVPTSRQVGT